MRWIVVMVGAQRELGVGGNTIFEDLAKQCGCLREGALRNGLVDGAEKATRGSLGLMSHMHPAKTTVDSTQLENEVSIMVIDY